MADEDERSGGMPAIVFSAMVAGRVVGAGISPLLFAHVPVVLIVLSPFLVHLVAVAPLVGAAIYFPVAVVVTTAQALVGFYFGSTLGARALEWLLERIPFPPAFAERLLELVRRASVIAIFVIPGPILGTIAGVAGVKRKTFYWLVAPAQAIWVAAAYFVGEALVEYIDIARTFVVEHALELTALTVTVVVLRLLYGRFIKDRAHEIAERWRQTLGR